jgi:hypothetical protein
MTRPIIRFGGLASTLALAFAGCANQAGMQARYDQSLQRWQGATRDQLVAAWGRPTLAQAFLNEETLTWTVNQDGHPSQPLPVHATPSVGAPAVILPTIAPTVPVRCTTQFQLRSGIVVGWKFDGLACGAPA